MIVYKLEKDVPVIYKEVPDFPNGIKDAFDELYGNFENRDYYGLSHMDERGRVIYKAAASQLEPGEATGNGYHITNIPAGDYLAEKVTHWMSKTGSLKDVFSNLMADPRFDDNHECVEWYLSDDEMLCMVKCK